MTSQSIRIERILFPTDFSAFSSQALRHALALARKFKARLKVVHVIPQTIQPDLSIYGSAPWLLTPETRQRIEQEMRRFLAPAREARIDHEVEICEGDTWRAVVGAAEQLPADLVVMGTHGRSGLERLFLGSVAEKLIRRLRCPVLTVSHEEGRTWQAPGLVSRILCATDFSDTSAEALGYALLLAGRFDSQVTLLHVVENLPDVGDPGFPAVPALADLRRDFERAASQRLRRAVDEIPDAGNRVGVKVVAGRAYKEILRHAAEERADLIVLGAQGYGPLERLLSGSNAQHVVRGATCPVLTVRPVAHERPPGGPAGGLALASPGEPSSNE